MIYLHSTTHEAYQTKAVNEIGGKMDQDVIAGRIWAKVNYQEYSEHLNKVQPILRSKKYVERIFNEVQLLDEPSERRRDIFISAVYQAYRPATYVASGVAKLPAGIRDEMTRLLQFNNPEMINHFRDQWSPAMNPYSTGPERPFRAKVMEIVEKFRQFSINPADHQYNLFQA